MRMRPRGVFAQLALVIALVLVGAGVLAVLLGREYAVRPATTQLVRTIDGLGDAIEAMDRDDPSGDAALRALRASGLEVRHEPPPAGQGPGFAPVLRRLQARASKALGAERDVRLGRNARGDGVLWVRLQTRQPLWVAYDYDDARLGSRRFSMLLLAGCVLLVWLAAAYFARRLAQPLRTLAEAAPALVRGEDVALHAPGAPREVGELQAALTRASTEVREAAAQRSLMLAGISHDLRTPLTRLQYALALLPDADPALREGMERDIAEIDAVLGQFIAYARDGRDEASERVDLAAICRNALAAADAGWGATLPAQALLDGKPIALLRAVENLIANAQRHGAPPYRLRLAPDGRGWRIDIEDHGPGLADAVAGNARQPFVRGDGGGSGLGLAIVDGVARLHGGELHLEANSPTGLRACLRLQGSAG